MFSVPDHLENTLHRGQNSTSAQHVQLVTELVQTMLYNKIEVRLDSTLSLFVIILYYILYHGVRLVVRIETAFKTIHTNRTLNAEKFLQ